MRKQTLQLNEPQGWLNHSFIYIWNSIIFTVFFMFTAVLKAEVGDVIWTIPQNGVLHCEMYGYLRERLSG